MTKKHHPSNRYERMKIKEIKDVNVTTGRSGRLRRKAREIETVKELLFEQRKELEDEVFTEQVR